MFLAFLIGDEPEDRPNDELPLVDSFSLGVSYRYRREIPVFYEVFTDVNAFKEFDVGFRSINQISFRPRLTIDERLTIGATTTYSIENQFIQQNTGYVEYTSGCRCWAARIDLNDSRTRGVQANFRIAILGLGEDTGSPFTGRGLGTKDME